MIKIMATMVVEGEDTDVDELVSKLEALGLYVTVDRENEE